MERRAAKRIAANTAALFSSHLIIKIISFVYLIFLARHLGEKSLGQLAFAAAFAELFNVFSDFGFSTVTVREVARKKGLSDHYLKNVLSMRLAISSLVFLAMIVVANLSGFSTEVLWAIALYGLAQIILTFGSTFQSVLNAFEKMHYGSLLSIASTAFISLTGFIFIHLGLGVVAFASLQLIWSLPAALGYFYCGRRESIKLGIGFDFKFWREISISAIPVGLGAAFYVIYNRIDLIMLKYMKGDYDVGIYAIAYRMMGYFHFIVWALMGATAPVFSNSFAENRARLRSLAERCVRYLMFLGIPLAAGGAFLARPIILFLYRDRFMESSGVLSLLMFSIMIIFFGATFGTILLNSDRKGSRFYAFVAAGGMILNVMMNLVLIPRWTYYGAAAATLATDFFTSFLAFFYVITLVGGLKIWISLAKACVSSLVMVVGLYFLEPFNLWLPVLIAISVVLYTLCAILLKFFQSRDMEVLKAVLFSPKSSPSEEILE